MPPVNPIGTPFFELGEVDSSNNYAMQKVQSQLAAHGSTWFAHFQNAGKGQRGKPWSAEPGQNIMVSTVLEATSIPIDNQFLINIIVALGCYDLFNFYAIDGTSIKWPNDIYWKDRKAGGILIENLIQGKNWKFAIAGIGININQTLFPPNLPNPVSLKQITGKTFPVVELAKELCRCLEKRWQQFLAGHQQEMLKEYSSHLYKLEQLVTFKVQNAAFSAIIKGVTAQGELIVDTGKETTIKFGSVEWVLPHVK